MGKRREIRVQAVGKPTKGMFKGELMPNEWLSSVDEIAEKWARRSFLQPAAAKGLIVSLEGFIEDELRDGNRLDFDLVSFSPRLSGGLSSRNADPESDGLHVRGAVKARRRLVNAPTRKLVAVNVMPSTRIKLYDVTDADTGKTDVISVNHRLVMHGDCIPITPGKPDEGIWLEKRRKGKVSTAEILKSDHTEAEFVFRDAVPRGKYFVVIGSRCAKGDDFRVVRARYEVRVV